MIIVDASVMIRALAFDGKPGAVARAELAADEHWAVPEHWRVEVFSSVRGLLLGGRLSERRALQVIEDLGQITVIPVPVTDLLPRMWELRGNVCGYDAAYVAAAELHDAILLTADARLGRANGPRCQVRVLP